MRRGGREGGRVRKGRREEAVLAQARCGAWQRGHGLVRAAGVDLEGPSCPVSSRTELHGSLPAPCTVIGVHGKGRGPARKDCRRFLLVTVLPRFLSSHDVQRPLGSWTLCRWNLPPHVSSVSLLASETSSEER